MKRSAERLTGAEEERPAASEKIERGLALEVGRVQAELDASRAELTRVQADLARTLADLRRIEVVLAEERRANLNFRARVGELAELNDHNKRALTRFRLGALIELEFAKLLCTLGARSAGTALWNRAKARLR